MSGLALAGLGVGLGVVITVVPLALVYWFRHR